MRDPYARNFSISCATADRSGVLGRRSSRSRPQRSRTQSAALSRHRSEPGQIALLFLGVLILAAALLASPPAAWGKKSLDPEELFNPLLGVDYSHWLVGPIVRIASEQEVESYLLLTSDEEAQAFIEKFWAARNEGTDLFKKTPQKIYAERVEEADKRFTERAYPGHRTDRGTIWILYGEPEEITFESPQKVGQPTLEVWKYSKKSEPGLDGERPKKLYRFYREGELTVFYTGRTRPDARDRVRQRRF